MAILIKVTALAAVLLLTGCATCTHSCILGFGPGTAAFNTLARMHDNPQSSGVSTYQQPLYITNTKGQTVGKISR